ncbi:MAG: trypsin-like serine protease [Myxococcales bacterium]|nr:trypsin-like serine protease [Myxococcales bacterium]MCB9709438.1 trypsin-like serine protease [Myxococcales bacterium]
MNDVAMLQLKAAIHLDQYPDLMRALDEPGLIPGGPSAWTLGWGSTQLSAAENKNGSDALQELKLPIGSEEDCETYAKTENGTWLYQAPEVICSQPAIRNPGNYGLGARAGKP